TATRAVAVSLGSQNATFSEGAISSAYPFPSQTITSAEGTITTSVSGDVTLSLAAITFQFAVGNISENIGYILDQNQVIIVGQTATFSEGAVTPIVQPAIGAETITSAQGTVAAPQFSLTLGSINLASTEGTLVAIAGNNTNNQLGPQQIISS